MTQFLNTLKWTAARKQRALPDVVKRRQKLLKKLHEQRELAVALNEGRSYSPKRLRTVRDAAGVKSVRETPIRIKAWWWIGEKGETLLQITYGSKALEIAKGKNAIDVGSEKELPTVLDTIIAAVQNCELDTQIEAASVKLRSGFKKTDSKNL